MVILVVFQPVFIPTIYAASSWSGESWEGDSWSGDDWSGQSWDGSNLKWKGVDWSGKSWTENSWEGSPWLEDGGWDGVHWEGSPWFGDDFTGNPYAGNPWLGSDFSGNPYTGNPWAGSGFSGNPYAGNPWAGSGFSGNPYTGNPWAGTNFTGNPYTGNAWLGNDYVGNSWIGQNFSGNSYDGTAWLYPGFHGNAYLGNTWELGGFTGEETSSDSSFIGDPHNATEPFYNTDQFDGKNFLIDKITFGTIEQIDGMVMNSNDYDNRNISRFITDLIVSNSKLHLGSHTFFDVYDLGVGMSGYENYIRNENMKRAQSEVDATSSETVLQVNQVTKNSIVSKYGAILKDSSSIVARNLDASNHSNTWGKMGALSKFNSVTSAINAGVSAYKTGMSVGNSIHIQKNEESNSETTATVAEIGTHIGETIMNAAKVAFVVPGGRAVGAGLLIAGAGIFVISKGAQVISNNTARIREAAKKLSRKLFKFFRRA